MSQVRPTDLSSRQRFQAALACQPLDRPPLWIMRQAGRYLPEYRALKEKRSFLELVKTPELALEVTLQPLRRFPFDAAILFSDILVVPEALGQGYRFREGGGIEMEFALDGPEAIARLQPAAVRERLDYVPQALRLVRRELDGGKMLLGFGGSPWTLATYMVEGGSSKTFSRVKALFYEERPAFDALMETLTAALIDYFAMQAEAGADAIQIFDSWGGAIAGPDYEDASLKWLRRIADALGDAAPLILYAKGTSPHLERQAAIGPKAVGVDWTIPLREAADRLPADVAIQGNLDPAIMNGRPETARAEARRLLKAMEGRPGHIFNLGHGILPEARIETVQALAETVVQYRSP